MGNTFKECSSEQLHQINRTLQKGSFQGSYQMLLFWCQWFGKHDHQLWTQFTSVLYGKYIQRTSSEQLNQLKSTLTEMFLFISSPGPKDHVSYSHHLVPVVVASSSLTIFFSETTRQNGTKLGRNVHQHEYRKVCDCGSDLKFKILHFYLSILKHLFSQKALDLVN